MTPGSKYLFTVKVNGNNGFKGTKNGFVSFGGVTGTSLLRFSHLGNDNRTVSTTVEASSSNMRIEIGTTTPGKYGPIIDEDVFNACRPHAITNNCVVNSV